jgi:hypothetical protein
MEEAIRGRDARFRVGRGRTMTNQFSHQRLSQASPRISVGFDTAKRFTFPEQQPIQVEVLALCDSDE